MSLKEIRRTQGAYLEKFVEELSGFGEEDFMNFFTTLTVDKALSYGFREWDNGLYLIPECFLEFLPNGLELKGISGGKVVVGKDYIDDDTRGGLIAYGVVIN